LFAKALVIRPGLVKTEHAGTTASAGMGQKKMQ